MPWIKESLNHKITEWLGLEGPSKPTQPHPMLGAGLPLTSSAAKGTIHPGLECLQGWSTHSFSKESMPVPHYPLSKKFLPSI